MDNELKLKENLKGSSLHNHIFPAIIGRKIKSISFLKEKYTEQGFSCQAIADLLGNITRQGVYKALKRFGIPLRSKKDRIFFIDGDRCKISNGYFWIYQPFHPHSNNGYVKRATLILEKKIGRGLEKNELPHHKDLNKLNDVPRNLELQTKSSHTSLHLKLRYSKRKRFIRNMD